MIPAPVPSRLAPFARRLSSACERVDVVSMRTDISPTLVLRLARLLRSGRYDIAHAHMVHADWYLAAASVVARSVPLVSSKHNPDAFRKLAPFRIVERAFLRRYSAVIAISEDLREFTERSTGVKTVTVHYGLSPSDEPIRPRARTNHAPRLLAVGRLEKQKGFEVAIEAMKLVKAAVPGAQLLIAGDGQQRSMLAERVEALGLDNTVSLLGNRDDVEELMRGADLLVHHARWEGFGLVLIEAMRAHLPIVASRVSAIPEVVADGESGLLVPPDDPQALAGAIIELLGDSTRRQAMGSAGFKRLRDEFSTEKMARGVANVYASVLGDKRSERRAFLSRWPTHPLA